MKDALRWLFGCAAVTGVAFSISWCTVDAGREHTKVHEFNVEHHLTGWADE